MRRRDFVTLIGGTAARPLAARAQQATTVARIGYLGFGSAAASASWVEALRAGLHDLGYVEGKNIVIEFRWVEGLISCQNSPPYADREGVRRGCSPQY